MRLAVSVLFALFFCAGAAAEPKLVFETKGLEQPESVVQDPATGAIYVSNIVGAVMQKDGNGYIAKLKPDGTGLRPANLASRLTGSCFFMTARNCSAVMVLGALVWVAASSR